MATSSTSYKRPLNNTNHRYPQDDDHQDMDTFVASPPKKSRASLGSLCVSTPGSSIRENGKNMKVYVRVRPENSRENVKDLHRVVDVIDEQMLIFDPLDDDQTYLYQGKKHREIGKKSNKNMNFYFDHVFDENSNNMQVFEVATKSFIASLMDGYNCAIFAYGATGAGKTHTMLGSADNPGVIFNTTMELYRVIDARPAEEQLEISISYFEIYNELVFDLLSPTFGKSLAVRDDPKRGVTVSNLSIHQPKDAQHLLEMMESGNKNRTQHPTDANAESSRSHAVFQISLKKQDFSSSQQMSIQISKMSLIDLAGSERASVAYKENRGKTLQREGGNINKSLLALGNCINALATRDPKKKNHIPYRNSKLTLLLRDSLGGNCFSAMIAAISPSSISYEDTHNTLTYAHRAKGIQLNLKRNNIDLDLQPRHYNHALESMSRKATEYAEENILLRAELNKLRNEIGKAPVNPVSTKPNSLETLNKLKNPLDLLFKERLELREDFMDCESNLRKIELKLMFRRLDKGRQEALMAATACEFSEKVDQFASLYSKKLYYSDRKGAVQKDIEENEEKLNQLEHDMREQIGPEDWIVEAYFKEQNMITEFKDKAFAEKHASDVAKELFNRLEFNEEIIVEAMGLNRYTYNYLNGMNRLSEELENSFLSLQRKVEGKKNVVWRDDQSEKKPLVSKELENIFMLPSFRAVPKTPTASYDRSSRQLTSVCSGLTPTISFSEGSLGAKERPVIKSKVAVVQAYHISKAKEAEDNDENMLNDTFTVTSSGDPPKTPHLPPNHSAWRPRNQRRDVPRNNREVTHSSGRPTPSRERAAVSQSPRYRSQNYWNTNQGSDRWLGGGRGGRGGGGSSSHFNRNRADKYRSGNGSETGGGNYGRTNTPTSPKTPHRGPFRF